MPANGQGGASAVRRRRLLLSTILAVAGLALLGIGFTVASGITAWVDVTVALLLLVASYGLQHLARREVLYRQDERS